MEIGKDYIGIGVGAIVYNADAKLFLAKRGPKAQNETGCWEFPGGTVHYGERLKAAIVREFLEEYGMQIQIEESLGAFDHILTEEKQHWVAVTFMARHTGGEPSIREPEKCDEIGWFSFTDLPRPLSKISESNVENFKIWHGKRRGRG